MSEESKKAPEAADEAPIEKTEVPHKKLYFDVRKISTAEMARAIIADRERRMNQ
jgi:hypothetical protein